MKIYLLALSLFFVIDMLWLGLIAKNFYASQIGFLLKTNVNWLAAITFYLLFVLGLVYFVISPASKTAPMLTIFLSGAFFGLVCYATYDLTNLATVKNWSVLVTVIDLFWGAFLGGIVSLLTMMIASKLQI